MIMIDRDFAGGQETEPVKIQTVLDGACDRVQVSRCTLRPGADWTPELYPHPAVTQMLLFLDPSGYVTTAGQAFPITSPALFIPEFDRDPFTVHAGGKTLRCIRIVSQMNQEDCEQIKKSHMVFPRFRLFSQAWEHTTRTIDAPDSNTRGFVLIENRKLGANNMGILRSARPGTSRVAQDTLKTYDQFIIGLEGADCELSVGEEQVRLQQGDIVYIPQDTPFRFQCGPEGRIHHVWYHLNRAYDL